MSIDLDSFGVCIGTLVLFVTRRFAGIWVSNKFSARVCCNLCLLLIEKFIHLKKRKKKTITSQAIRYSDKEPCSTYNWRRSTAFKHSNPKNRHEDSKPSTGRYHCS